MEPLFAVIGVILALFGLFGLFAGATPGLTWFHLLVGAGLLDLSGRFVPNEQAAEIAPALSRRLLARQDGERIFVLGWNGEEGDVESAVYLSQRDVRELQFAKASIATGWSLLVEERGIDVGEIQQVLPEGGGFITGLDRAASELPAADHRAFVAVAQLEVDAVEIFPAQGLGIRWEISGRG